MCAHENLVPMPSLRVDPQNVANLRDDEVEVELVCADCGLILADALQCLPYGGSGFALDAVL